MIIGHDNRHFSYAPPQFGSRRMPIFVASFTFSTTCERAVRGCGKREGALEQGLKQRYITLNVDATPVRREYEG